MPIVNINAMICKRMMKVEAEHLRIVGKIDVEKYRCISDDITCEEVIITEERVVHIKERHPGDFEKIEDYIEEALKEPDYILKDKKVNTGLVLKRINDNDFRFQIVLRVHTFNDRSGLKNSIISAWQISDSRWNNYINNKIILYKNE